MFVFSQGRDLSELASPFVEAEPILLRLMLAQEAALFIRL